MMTFPGWTWEYIDDHMTMPRFNAMQRYWSKHPPLHILAAGMAGYRGKPDLPSPDEVLPELPEFEEGV